MAAPQQVVASPHPLDALSVREVTRASAVCRRYAVDHAVGELRYNTVMLQEPTKAELLAYDAGRAPMPRRVAQCVLIVPTRELVVEAYVLLGSKDCGQDDCMLEWKLLEGVHPMTTPDDNFYAEAIVKADARIAQLVKERYGVTDVANELICDTWACHAAPDHLNAKRLMQGFLYLKLAGSCDNEYAHPLDMVPIVDLNAAKVVHIDMYDVPSRVPRALANYHRDLVAKDSWRSDVKQLNVTQPEGPSFALDGGLLRWQRWRMRLGFNAREGLVLHNVCYEDPVAGRTRPILFRASLAEMAVPYGDPHMPYIRKCAFDVGDYGFGFCANSLQLGCDCLGHIRYVDAVVNNAKGEAVEIPKAICIHEEDAGVLWKHWDCRTNHSEVRRSRRLVVSMVSTFMNYEYALYWYFYQDGSIHFELKLTGILSTSVAPVGEEQPAYGVRVAEGVNATVHQHFFCMRLDPSVDDDQGGRNVVVAEAEARPLPRGPANPAGNGFKVYERELLSTHQAQCVHNFATARHWALKNPFSLNPISKRPVAYRLLPAASPSLMADEDSLVARRAVFARKQLWVTPFRDGQLYPAGEHVVQSTRCMGLAEWTKEDSPLLGCDPVVWYSFGVTHIPRVEDFPVMPVEVCGFALKPDGFFAGNPAVDLPPERNALSREDGKQQGGAGGVPAAACCAPSKL